MDIKKSKNFSKVVQHSGAAERVAEDTRKNSNYYNPKKKKYEYSDPDEEIADVLARNSYRRSEVPEYRQQTPEESLAQRRQIIRAADDRSDLERLQDERRSYARQYGGQTRNTIDKLLGIALERTDSERAAQKQKEANLHMATLDEYDKQIQKAKEEERQQKIVSKYSDIPKQKDFADKSRQIDQSNQDSVYRAVNGLSESVGSAVAPVGASGIAFWGNRLNKAMDDTKYNQMTDEQRGVFNYLYNTDGAEAAHEYLSAINKDLERKATDATIQSQREMAKDGVTGAILANAATVGENLMSAPGYIVNAAAKAAGGSVGDTYDLANLAGKMSTETRKTTGEAIAKQDFWADKNTSQGNIGTWIYDAGMSMADSVASMVVGQGLGIKLPVKGSTSKVLNSAKKIAANASSLIMASQMATQTVTDMKEKGFSDDRALGVGALYGAVEYISEKLSLDAILGAGGNVFARLAKSFASEGSEEVASNILDRIVDTLANGNQSEMMAAFDEYRAQGLSNSQALAKVVSMAGQEDLSAFLAGGLSGMAMSGANEAIMSGEKHLQQDIYGKDVRRSGNAGELIDAGLTADKNSKLYRIAAELADTEESGKTVSKRQLGKLAMEMQSSDDTATTQAQKTVLEDAVRQRLQDSGVKNVDKATSRFVSSYFDGEGKIKGDKATKALYAELQDNSTDWAQSTTRSMAYEMLRGGASGAYLNELLVNDQPKSYNEFKDTYGGITEAKIAQLEQERLEQEPAEQRGTEHDSADTSYDALLTEAATPVDLQRAEPVPESQVKGVLKVQDGHTVVELQDGTKTTTDYVKFDNPNTKAVYKSAAKFGTLGAYALVKNYDSKVNPYSYLHAAESFYNAGASGKITFDQAVNTLSAPIEMGIMDRGAANELFLSGQEQSKEIGTTKNAVTQANKNHGGVVTLTGEATVTSQEKEVLDRVAAKTKLDIVLDGSLESNDNGYIDPANGKVVLNPDSGHIYATLMHELGEYTHAYNTAEMMDACRPIVEYMLATGDYAHDDKIDLLQKYVDGYSENGKQYSVEDAVSEMIFDFISGEASTQEGGEKFAKWLAEDADLTQKEKKSVVEKIKDFFTKLLNAVRSVIEGQGTLNTTARAGQKAAQQVPVLDDFFNALDNAIDNRQRMLDGEQRNTTDDNSSTGIRFSKDIDQYPYDMQTVIKEYLAAVDNKILKFIQDFKSGSYKKKVGRLQFGEVSDRQAADVKRLLGMDIQGFNNSINTNALRHIEKRHGVNGEHDHSMKNANDLARVGYILENYDGVDVLRDQNGNPVYSTEFKNKDGSYAPMVGFFKKINGTYYVAESIVDSRWKKAWVTSVYINKNRHGYLSTNMAVTPHQFTPETPLRSPVSANTKVTQNEPGVNTHSMQNGQKNAQNGGSNTQHSLEVDREYQRANEEQKAKIIEQQAKEWGAYTDADGNPVKLYHGTSQFGFTEFDLNKMDDGRSARSIFMTSNPAIASTYSGVEDGKKISEHNRIDVDSLSNTELANQLNMHGQEPTVEHNFSVVDAQGRKSLTSTVNGEFDWFKDKVEKEVGRFADEEIPSELKRFYNGLDYQNRLDLSDKLWIRIRNVQEERNTLMHNYSRHGFSESDIQQLSQMEQNMRLLEQLTYSDNAEPMIVKSSPGRFGENEFTLFSIDQAKEELRRCLNKGNYSLYAKLQNPLEIDASGKNWNDLDYRVLREKYEVRKAQSERGSYQVFNNDTMQPEWIDGNRYWSTKAEAQRALNTLDDNKTERRIRTTRDVAEYAKNNGYDGVVFRNITDNGGQNKKVSSHTQSDVYVAFNPNAVKSADTITYDNDGRVIPPSKRFTDQSDIRYSKQTEEVDSQGNKLTKAQQRRYKNVAPELRDEDGKIKPFYHGTARADRVGYVFDPKRATSGPMAYFTDDPDIATNYSKDKADTSIAYDSDYDSYETQFQVNGKPVTEYWNTLTAAEKKAMTEKIKQVTLDDNDNIVLKPGNHYGIGNFNDYELHRAKGNALSVLVDGWLNDGTLWNEESRFLDVLKAVGIDQAQYNDPDYREEKVYQAYLNITNPYNTGKLDQSFIDDLQSYVDNADMSRYATDNAQADMWDKNGIPIEDWLERLQDDLDNGTTHAWTTVPDVVTDFLKDSGYDGIVDQGGKNGGDQHTVAIPFYSNQIKEVANGNPTDSPDIRYSKRVGFNKALTGAEKKKYNRAMQTGEDAGLRISDNSILVECENNSKYQYKYVVYDDMEDGPVIRDVYAIGRIDPNVEDDVASQCHEIARFINAIEEEKYDNREHVQEICRHFMQNTSYILARYNYRNSRFHVIGRGSVENGRNTLNKSVRERTAGQDTRAAGELTESRKSKSIDDTGRTSLLRDDKRLDEMNITLRQVFDSQEFETGHHTSQTQVQRVARQLKKSTGSKMDTPRLMVQLKGLFDYIGNNEDVTFSSVMDQAKEIAHELLDNLPEQEVREEYAQDVLDALRGMKIQLSDEQKAETAYHHDRYGNYRKRLFGSVNLVKDGQYLDSAWQELAARFPGTFDPDENSQNMPERLLEIVEDMKDSYYSYEGMNMDDAATTVAYDIFDAYMDTPEYKTYAQRQNDRFTAMQNKYRKRLQSVKDDYRQRYEEKLRAVQSKNRQDKADMRTKYADQLKAQRQLYAERRHRDVEKRRKTVQKNKIKKQILDLMSLAANGGKERRVPNGLLDSVKELGRAVLLDGKAGERLDSYLNKVRDGFDKIEGNNKEKTEYATLVEDYNNLFKGQILQLKESIGDKSINDMTADELEQTYQLIRSVKKAVTNSNRLFKAEKAATVESQGQQIIRELKGSKKDPNGKKTNERIEFLKGFGYNALKPEYFFAMQGSPTLRKYFHNLRSGQDTWARDCYDARQYSQRMKEKYHAYNWNQRRTFTLETQYGEKLKFNLQQLLYLYALSRREPAMQHLTQGGMVFDKVSTRSKRGKRIVELTDNTAHPLTVEDIAKATDMLTKEQKAYAQDMQRYLADTMGAKGNEVSRVMYDMDLFTDSDYIPMRSAGDYVQYIQDKANGDAKIKNSGFTNQLNVHANNALVISSFDDVWANHVNDMALYHAFTLPLEDFQRVYNYHTQVGENGTVSQAVRGYMDTESKRYIEQFIRDLNGGVRPDNGSRYVNKGISLFKKGAVFASASVAIQQPSAIARAMAVIPAKHFVATTISKRDYAQLQKYAPVAIVKEMGYFDTGMGKTATDWINEDKPRSFGQKLGALFTDSDYRDSVLSVLPEKADELTWAHIWSACVHEAKTDFHLTGEAAYQKAGERFSEVVDRTQVYDSVFSRSGMMRSSDNAMKMATAFMAEPTTSLNMLVDAVYQVKNGNAPKSYGARVVGSLVAAAALNSILQSIVTAARDDDDDKTYLEVYLGQLRPNMWSNLNPAGQIPMLKDAISIFQGYDVSRADMNLFADLYDAVQAMDSDTISTDQKINRLAGALSAFVGLPYKNVARDVQSVFNVIHKATLDMHTGATGTKEVFNEEMKGQLLIDDLLEKFGIEMFPDTDKSAKLYKAVSTGDQETVDRMQRDAGDDETFNRMLVAAVKANDQNAGKAAQAHLEGDYDGFDARLQDVIKLGFSDEIAVKAVDGIESAAKALITAKENDDGTEEYKAEYKEKFDQVVATGFDAKALEKYVSDHVDTSNEPKGNLKSRYDYSDVALAISKNDSSGTKRMRQDLIDTAVKNGYTKDKAEDMVDKAIRREFSKSDERLLRAAEAYKVGAFDTYEANVRAIAADDYFTMDEVATMAKGRVNKTGIPYSSSDVVKAMESNSGKVKSIISQLEKAGKAGKDGAYIKSRITAEYKDKYIKGNETTRRNIRQKMYNTGLYTADEIYKRTSAWLKSK